MSNNIYAVSGNSLLFSGPYREENRGDIGFGLVGHHTVPGNVGKLVLLDVFDTQLTADENAGKLREGDFEFDVVCGPSGELYHALAVRGVIQLTMLGMVDETKSDLLIDRQIITRKTQRCPAQHSRPPCSLNEYIDGVEQLAPAGHFALWGAGLTPLRKIVEKVDSLFVVA